MMVIEVVVIVGVLPFFADGPENKGHRITVRMDKRRQARNGAAFQS